MKTPASSPKPPRRAVPLEEVRRARGESRVAVQRSKVATLRSFRRIRSDRLLGLLGVLLVVVATVLVFSWPAPPQKKTPAFSVAWEEDSVARTYTGIEVPRDNATWDVLIEVPQANVTTLSASINWSDDVGDEGPEWDVLNFTLKGPDQSGVEKTVRDVADNRDGRNVTLRAHLVPVPSVRQVPAKTEDEARAAMGDQTTKNGTGTWTLRIHLDFVGDDYSNATRGVGNTVGCSAATSQIPNGGASGLCTYDPGQALRLVWVEYKFYRLGGLARVQ